MDYPVSIYAYTILIIIERNLCNNRKTIIFVENYICVSEEGKKKARFKKFFKNILLP